ncbi:unnamed protein product [Strongylus vulgaris]|uniref:Reverse transcriptase domain-containing protein n=1 Tax=Strongylus vulgaris TaxID=40348 RepID=A0A3P7IQ35_STRVU|nr:unnamed protein product [Strongylus vulgaris]
MEGQIRAVRLKAQHTEQKDESFKYLGCRISGERGFHELMARANATWMEWRAFTGALCNKQMPMQFKFRKYGAVFRPTAMAVMANHKK